MKGTLLAFIVPASAEQTLAEVSFLYTPSTSGSGWCALKLFIQSQA